MTCILRRGECFKSCIKNDGLNRDLNPGPPAPKAGIIPLDHWANYKKYLCRVNFIWLTHESHGSRKETFGWWWKIGRVTEIVRKRRLIMWSKIAKFFPDDRKSSTSTFSRRKETAAGHHARCHLLHSPLFTSFVLEPNLKLHMISPMGSRSNKCT